MQQKKRRSKKGVILLALALALFVMAILPTSALAAAAKITIDNGPLISSKTVNITYNSATPGNPGIAFVWIRDRVSSDGGVTWSALAPASPTIATYIPYVGGTTVSATYTLQSKAVPVTGDLFQVTTDFFGVAPTYLLVEIGPFSNIVSWNNVAPHSTVDFIPAGSLGRSDVPWTNQGVLASFDESNGAFMGTTYWSVNYQSVDYPQPALQWIADTPPPDQKLVGPVVLPPYLFNGDGIYWVTHYAVSYSGQAQPGTASTDGIGYDTKIPTVVWSGLDADWNTKNIPFTATITDSGGSGVAGVAQAAVWVSFNDGLTWALNVGTATNPQLPLITTQDTFDLYKFYVKGTIAVIPNTHAMYKILLTAWDIAGNIHVYLGEPHIDNMPPSTAVQYVKPAGSELFMHWTNKPVTVTLIATDAGGNGAPSGVKYTEYILGDSGTKSPVLGSTAAATGTTQSTTNPTDVLIDKTAAVGPVYLFYRSVDVAGNAEAWKVVWIWFDNVPPVMSNNSTGLWYNQPFGIKLTATDPNSEISPAGIEYQVPGWPLAGATFPFVGQLPRTWTPLPGNPGVVTIPVDPYPLSRTDGLWNIGYRATDNAGNASVDATVTAKIDTRPPTTIGTAGFGDAQWVNGTVPFVLTGTDQAIGAGMKVTFYRVDQGTPWQSSIEATPTTSFSTNVALTPVGGTAVQGAMHTVDFFSIDNATNVVWLDWPTTDLVHRIPYPGNVEAGVLVGSWTPQYYAGTVTGYKTRTVKLDITAPVVTAVDPKNGAWQKGPGIINFSGTDVGSGYAYTEWSTDGGTNWKQGESAEIGGNSPATGTVVTYHGVDNVGLKSANQTITVKVASTPPTVTGGNVSVKSGNKAAFSFNVTAVTPKAQVIIQIRTKSGRTLSTHHYANVGTNADMSRSFRINLPAGKYNIRIGAVDEAGNVQTQRGGGTLTVK